jgi:hypothetical protein
MWEGIWTWITRGCALVGFGFLLAGPGFNAPWAAYILLIGLFFGPDVIKGQISIKGRDDK